MMSDHRLPTPALRARAVPARAKRAANDGGQLTGVAVVLLAVTNANSMRRTLGFDYWGGAFLSFVSVAKSVAQGGQINQFAWDTVCLVFDAITLTDFERCFTAFATAEGTAAASIREACGFEFVAGAAFATNKIDALERAERALVNAKLGGYGFLDCGNAPPQGNTNVNLAGDLALAVPRGELFVVYQPKVRLRQRVVASAEALIRWQHPVLGLVMPDAFINLADETGEMRAITLWTLRRVIADQQQLADGGQPLRIFINISGRLLTDRVFIEAACRLIEDSDAAIGFEITETAVISDPDLAIENLETCAARGITLAIDDYGSGLSSLSYLKRLPATELKIDKMFITQLTSSHRDPLIVRSTIDLAHALGMEVTAEGVETPAALALLTAMGCEMVQGYLISLPLEFQQFQAYLADYRFETFQTSVEPTIHRPASFWKRA